MDVADFEKHNEDLTLNALLGCIPEYREEEPNSDFDFWSIKNLRVNFNLKLWDKN